MGEHFHCWGEDGRCVCGMSEQEYSTRQTHEALAKLHTEAVKHSEYLEGMRHTAAAMDGIDNSWNLLHIASQLMSGLLLYRLQRCHSSQLALVTEQAAEDSLKAADALLRQWRKSQGNEYG